MELVAHRDFNSAFSPLARLRAIYLEQVGIVRADWRAVEHAPDILPAEEMVRPGWPIVPSTRPAW